LRKQKGTWKRGKRCSLLCILHRLFLKSQTNFKIESLNSNWIINRRNRYWLRTKQKLEVFLEWISVILWYNLTAISISNC